MNLKRCTALLPLAFVFIACSKGSDPDPGPPSAITFQNTSARLNNLPSSTVYYGVQKALRARFSFNAPVDRSTVINSVSFKNVAGANFTYTINYENGDSTIVIQHTGPYDYLTKYRVQLSAPLRSTAGNTLGNTVGIDFYSGIDSTRKFPLIDDEELLTRVQQQTFKYFWDYGHPVSGLARERSNGDENTVTSGGSGFGVMAIVTGISRNFITRMEGLSRMQKIVAFLKDNAKTFHGAYPHWMNGATGAVIPFSANDNGADLVETSYLMQGLLIARQFFSNADPAETTLRNDINTIWNRVEWDWFRKGSENVLYWHWSEDKQWVMNLPIKGWNESLITYVLAAASTTHTIPKEVYDNGWASNGGIRNNATYFGYKLPLGPDLGGPLFFSHYSFLGINPNGLSDAYADYALQTKNHTLINYNYVIGNPKNYYGYSDSVWGLTASDIKNGYTDSSPTNDVGVIAPTAALSSFPYTPVESMKALKFFYYTLGDKLWKDYGFIDAFSLHDPWFAGSFLAIDQGPIILMIENYRSGLLWNLFTSCPEIKTGMTKLGFTAPYL